LGRISRGWRLTKLSLRVIKKDKELLLFPVLSGLFMILIMAGFIGGMFLSVGLEGMFEGGATFLFIAMMAVMYFLIYFVGIFFNAAIIGCAMIRLEGGMPNLKDGFRIGRENIRRILAWALFAATVGLVLRAIQERAGIIGKIIIGFIGVAWALGTFFVVPVLIFEKVGPIDAMKRSASLFRKSWGETLAGSIGLGLIFLLAGLLGILAIIVGFAVGGVTGLIVGLVVAFIYWIALAIVASAAQSVLVAALYRYATTGEVSKEFGSQQLYSNPWGY